MELRIENLTKAYGDVLALNHFTAEFTPGIYGILGPSGAGKSTFMNILCLLKQADGGKIQYDGKDIRKLQEKYLKKVGYMPQHFCLYDDFTLEEYLYYIGALKGIPRRVLKERVEKLTEEVKLSDVCGKKLKTFSGGMKQRAMLVQALLNNPEILILDEPTAGLDPQKRIEIRNLIARLSKNKIVLIATHVVSDIEFIANHIVLLKKGNIVAIDSPGHLLEQIRQNVCEIEVQEQEIKKLEKEYLISNLHYVEGKLFARIILKDQSKIGNYVYPNLEDVYLYYFGGE